MVCRTARACTICLNALFILIGTSLAATAGYMLHVTSKYEIPGAPIKIAIYAVMGLGIFLTMLACLGMQGSGMIDCLCYARVLLSSFFFRHLVPLTFNALSLSLSLSLSLCFCSFLIFSYFIYYYCFIIIIVFLLLSDAKDRRFRGKRTLPSDHLCCSSPSDHHCRGHHWHCSLRLGWWQLGTSHQKNKQQSSCTSSSQQGFKTS